VLPTAGGVDGQGLVAVEPIGPGAAQGGFQRWRQRPVQVAVTRFLSRQALDMDGLALVAGQLGDLPDERGGIHRQALYHQRQKRTNVLTGRQAPTCRR